MTKNVPMFVKFVKTVKKTYMNVRDRFVMRASMIALASVFILLPQPAKAWGWPHRLIAYTAQEHCTPATRAELDRYLDAPLNNVASWLDQFRSAPWTGIDYSWAPTYTFKAWEHAVSVDENCRPLDHSNREEGNGEGYSAYLRYVSNLRNRKNLPDSAVIVDLKALIHIIGDVHCPGHILYSIDKETPDTMGGGIAGGYGIWTHMYKGKEKTLHSLLDDADFIHPEFNRSLEKFREYMDTVSVEYQKRIIAGTMADYIQDAALRSKVVYDWVKPGQEVDDSFFTDPDHEKLLLYLIQASAYRTAHILNTIFDPDYTGPVDDGFARLHALATAEGAVAPEGAFIEALVTSDPNSANMAANPQVEWNKVDVSMCRRTAYVQDAYGRNGVKIIYADASDNKAPQFSRVKIDLKGCRLLKESSPERYVVEGVKRSAVEILGLQEKVAPKHRRIAEVTDADIYTYVTLDDVEFISKEGSYTNVRELNVQPTYINFFKKKADTDWFDEAGIHVKDGDGDAMFLPVNTVCDWRRRGDRLPAGIGSVSGIIVSEKMSRSGCKDALQLRMTGPDAVDIPVEEASSYTEITEWNWDRNYYDALKCESGEKQWLEGSMIASEKIFPDKGKGRLWVSMPATMGLEKEFNSRSTQDGWTAGEGSREKAAVAWKTGTADWYAKAAGLYAEFSTRKFVGRGLSLDLVWAAGDGTDKYGDAAPSEWKVSYSVNGGKFVEALSVLQLRTLAWAKGAEVPADAAVGYVYNTVLLPSELLDKDKVTIRIYPASPAKTADKTGTLYLRVGKLSAKALK